MRMKLVNNNVELIIIKDFRQWRKGMRFMGMMYQIEVSGEFCYQIFDNFILYQLYSDVMLPIDMCRDSLINELIN